MDAGALEVHLRRLPGVVACQLTATEVVLLVGAGDPAAIRIATRAVLDQAGSNRRVRVLAPAAVDPPVALWRRRRFAVLAGAAGALSAGIAAASTLASMPGAVRPPQDVAIVVPDAKTSAVESRGVRTLVPAPASPSVDAAVPVESATTEQEVLAAAGPASAPAPAPATGIGRAAGAPTPAVPPAVPAAPAPSAAAPPAPAATPEPGVVAATADVDDDRSGRGRGHDDHPVHPHGEPPGYLHRAGHGPW